MIFVNPSSYGYASIGRYSYEVLANCEAFGVWRVIRQLLIREDEETGIRGGEDGMSE
jgi:hypothetical protein